MRCLKFLVLVTCVLTCARQAAAQQSVDYASISGRVTDQSGAVLPDADVTARHVDTNGTVVAVTDGDGRFRFPYLKVGRYAISVRHAGFSDASRVVTASVGAAYELPVTLAVAGVDANVVVPGEAPMLEAARSQIAGTVSLAEVQALPLNGRNFLDVALLIPGVSPTNTGSTQLFAETSAVPGTGISVASQRNLSNNFVVDGLSANDDAAGLSGITYGVDAIEQFQVVTSGAQAELGRALGGYVNVVTRSGTNVLHGAVYHYGRHDRLNARNALSRTKLPMRQAQFGGSLGGPVARDRTFYFTNVEHRRLRQSGLVTIAPSTVDAVNARLASVGYRGSPIAAGAYSNPVDATNLLGKVDHRISGRHQVGTRYSLYDMASANARGAGALNAATASSSLDNRDQNVAISSTMTLSSRTVLEMRAQFADSRLHAPPSDPLGPAVSIAGAAVFGTLSSSPTARSNRAFQIVNNLSHQTGAHALRVGADVLYNHDDIVFPRASRGMYTFASLANFLAGAYNNAGYTQTFGATAASQTNPNLGIYVQDEWKVLPRLTLNAGLRYDLQFLESIDTDTDNLSPRLGVAWSPFQSRRTIVRGGIGLFHDRVPLRAVANALLSAGNTTDVAALRQTVVTLSPSQNGAPVFPDTLGSPVPTVTLPNLTTIDRRLQNAYSRQTSVEVEHQLGERITVSLGYHDLRGRRLLMAVNQNVPTCVASGGNNGCRPNATYANNSQYSSVGSSEYAGLHLSLMQRPRGWGHYRVSYTWSTSMNNVGEFFFSAPIDPTDLSKDWGRSDDDQRHRLVLHGAVHSRMAPAISWWQRVSHGYVASAVLQSYSALPFNITSGMTTLQGTVGRPAVDGAFIARNAGHGTPSFNLNARVSRAFRLAERLQLETLLEGFNLTNRANVILRNTNFGPGAYPSAPAATFGQITAVAEPRSFQVGVRLTF